MQLKYYICFWTLLGLLLAGCNPSERTVGVHDAQVVVDSAIARGNLNFLSNAEATFDFRDRSYSYTMIEDEFEYTRLYIDSTGSKTLDILTNNGLTRYINDKMLQLTDKEKNAYTNSVNSVIYFAFLPHRLNDTAVIKRYLGKVKIFDNDYHKIQVSFRKEGGGEDFEDVFIYWFDVGDYRMGYLAYEYKTDGGGIRFREANNARDVAGIRIQDYINYRPKKETSFELSEIEEYYQQAKLEKLSEINLKNVYIKINDN